MELVSIIMPVYNTKEEWLRLAIESVLSQSYSNIELIIVTDGPTDNSVSVVEEYAQRDNRVVIIKNEKNLGIVKTLNNGIKFARGEYIARMDSDDICLPDRIMIQMSYIKMNNLDLIGGRIRKIDEKGNYISDPSNSYSVNQIKSILPLCNCIPHPTWLAKTSVIIENGGYREIKHCEDYDFLLRALSRGYIIGLCDQVVLNYRINTDGITRSNSLVSYLSSRYLRRNINRIDAIDQNEINRKILKKISANNALHFEKSVSLFQISSVKIKGKKYFSGFIYLLKGLLVSKYSWSNFACILKVNKFLK